MKIKPLRDLMLIEPDEKTNKTKSGFFLKEDWDQTQNTGTIKAVGGDVQQFKPGDRVYFNPYAMLEANLMEQNDQKTGFVKARFIKEDDVLATL
jgi:co-chaperonin GroES (HSP10)